MECNCERLSLDNCSYLKDFLPEGYDYRICDYVEKERNQFKAVVRLPLKHQLDVEKWFAAVQTKSCTTWRADKTYKIKTAKDSRGRKNNYRMDFRCQHNTRPRTATANLRAGSKNTSCAAFVYLVTKRWGDQRGRIRSSDPHIKKGYVTKCTIANYHNHETKSADALRRRDVSETTREKLISLFKSGHSPTTALETVKYDLQEELNVEEYSKVSADRSVCPDAQYCYRLYYSTLKQGDDGKSKVKITVDLKSVIEAYNKDQEGVCASHGTTEDGQTVVVICSPVMKRIHTQWPGSAEMAYIESSGTMGRHKSHSYWVFLLLTHSPVGGLPLGVIITTSESESTIKYGLDLMTSVYPEGAFFGRAQQGPVSFMTDDVEAQRMAVHSVYPASRLLLCTFHLLQALWRYLLDPKHHIAAEDRPSLFYKVKSMMHAETVQDLQTMYRAVGECALCRKYGHFLQYVSKLYDRREEWSLAYHSSLALRNTTNNYAETAMKMMKDKLLYQRKGYKFPQLVHFLITRLPGYFERKLIDASNNRLDGYALSAQFYPKDGKNLPQSLRQISESEYEVKDQQQQMFQVNTDLGICSCPIGKTGCPCKHQGAVLEIFGGNVNSFLPVMSSDLRSLFYKIGTGIDSMNSVWFQPLRAGLASVPLEEASTMNVNQSNDDDDDDYDVYDYYESDDDASLSPLTGDVSHIDEIDGSQAQSSGTRQDTSHQEALQQALHEMYTSLKYKLETSPEVFKVPIQSFTSSFSKVHSRRLLVSALRSFGKSIGKVSRKARHKRLQTSTKVKGHPTSAARRKMPRGGRRRHAVGRPRKEECIAEHDYSKQETANTSHESTTST